jgi:tetratricopeptide (TPR) repeat protein
MPVRAKTQSGKRTPSSKVTRKKPEPRSTQESVLPPGLGRISAICFLLAVATLVLYSPTGTHPFTNYDDNDYVVQNSHVTAGLKWDTVIWALTATEASNWHPLTWLSHALDCQLFGLDPSGHHWTSVVIHALNAVLLFLLQWRATGATGRSLVVAALFAVHPLNVESVAWIAERKNVLSTLLFLLTLGAYGWYAQRPRLSRYAIVAGLFSLGLMAKPMLVTLPFVLLLIDYWPLRRTEGSSFSPGASGFVSAPLSRLMLEKLPLLALSAGSAVLTVVAQGSSLAPSERFPLGIRLENAVYSCGMYLAKAFWPARLALFYPHPGNSLQAWQWIGAGFVLVAISAFAWTQASNRPYLLVGWCWFLGTLVPVLGLVQVGTQAMADRYAYVPLIGIFLAVAWSVNSPVPATARAVLATIVLGALSLLAWRQIGYWKTNFDLWSHTLSVTGKNLAAEDKLGSTLQAMGQQEEAITHFANALALDPLDPLSNFSLGADRQWHGRVQESVPFYQITIRQATDARLQADAYQNLGTAYLQLGDPVRAREDFLLALNTNPGLVTVFAGLGELAGEPARTLSHSAVEHPAGETYLELGRVLQEKRLLPEARLAYAEALRLNPTLADAQLALQGLSPTNAGR